MTRASSLTRYPTFCAVGEHLKCVTWRDDTTEVSSEQQLEAELAAQSASESDVASEWSDRDILTALMCAGADLNEPRHVLHYTYFLGESAAYRAAADMSAAGWYVEVAGPEGGEDDWLVLGQNLSVVLTEENVREARRFFEAMANKYVGDYEGWEASL